MRYKRLILIAATIALLIGLSAWELGLQLAEKHRKERRLLAIHARMKVLWAERDASGRRDWTPEAKQLGADAKAINEELRPWSLKRWWLR